MQPENRGQRDPTPSPLELWESWPLVTKYVCAYSFLLTLVSSFGIISPYYYLLDFNAIFALNRLEIWRLITNVFFFGPFSFNFLINFMIFMQHCNKLEEDHFEGRTADFVFCFIVGIVPMTIGAYLLDISLLSLSLVMYLVYIWCNLNPDRQLQLMFIPVKIPSRYFPWALAALHMLMGGSIVYDLLGIICGHIYYFFDVKYPQEYGDYILKTPAFLYWLFPPENFQTPAMREQAQRQSPTSPATAFSPTRPTSSQSTQNASQQQSRFRYFSGQGRRLGHQ